MSKVQVTDKDIEKWYGVVVSCLRKSDKYSVVVKKFSPDLLRLLVSMILDRIYFANFRPEEFDWCMLIEGLENYSSVYEFFRSLDDNQLIPPDPKASFKELIDFCERKLHIISVKVNDVTTFRSVTKVEGLRKEIVELKKLITEIMNKLSSYSTGQRMMTYSDISVLRRELELMNWDRYFFTVKDLLIKRGLPSVFVDKLVNVKMGLIREMFINNKTAIDTALILIDDILDDISVYSAVSLAMYGINIRPVQVTKRVVYALGSMRVWAERMDFIGYKVHEDLVPFSSRTEIVHDPTVSSPQVVCAVYKGKDIHEYADRLLGCSVPAIIYAQFDDVKELYWMYYKELLLPIW